MPAEPVVAGLVLAAGGSSRLGEPKQLLPYGAGTLLDHVLGVARECPFQHRLCVVSGDLPGVDFSGFRVVVNPDSGSGCSSSVAAALAAVDPGVDVLVLMLGDQPGVRPSTVAALLAARGEAPLAACAYADGRGHPLAFSRRVFGELGAMHGDKAVWKLLDRHADEVVEVPIEGPVPLDVDTWEDYRAVAG